MVDRLGDLLATVIRVVQGTLELIADVEPKAVVVLWSLLLDKILDTSITAKATPRRVRTVCS